MKKTVRVLALLFAIIMVATAFTGCQAKKNELVMATNAAFPPFESKDGDNIIGIDPDIAQKIADASGKTLKIDDMEFESIITAVSSGKADMGVAGMTIDGERLKNVDFSDTYYNAAQVVIVLKDSTLTDADLNGKKIGVQTGTTGEKYVKENYKKTTASGFSNGIDAVLALKSNKIDAVVIDNETAKALAKANPEVKVLDKELTEEAYAICVKKGNTELLKTINDTISKMKSDGSLDEIFAKYIK
ncbi:MAG: hypothetical protein BGN88_07240 [Clostridiales bacterium 43-6]|nr:MAG: hypothetical protein BGN88_07240 [Clostridiales bacterium 43-6]